ncbi:MAG: methyltransferase domain-containing protein, partial [Candidatus Diapherotrites archaeon]|nr:methyltransferase domain-containing protein [Candidatus Diapherotrites archaeon]
KGNASILDIGCGKGIALRNIMEKIKGKKRKKLRLSGLTLARLSEHEQAKKEGVEIRIGRIETKRLDSQYDLIFSIAGGLHYSQTPIKALEKTLAALKLGGIALIDSGQEKKIEKYLEQEYPGFVYRKTSSSRLIIQKSPNNNALEELIKRHAFHLPGS